MGYIKDFNSFVDGVDFKQTDVKQEIKNKVTIRCESCGALKNNHNDEKCEYCGTLYNIIK